ncbi:hypothetical protein Tco_1452259 [Tanacetum coccineum]
MNPNQWVTGMLDDPTNQIPGSSSNPTNNSGSSSQPQYNQMPYYPKFQTPFANAEEQMLFNQFKMQMQFNQFSQQQQQPNQVNASQPQSDQQSYHLVDETEDEEESVLTPTSKKTSRGSRLKSNAKKSKEKEPQVETK